MAYFIGTDEAGYGPNLGPLVIAASVWQVAGQDCELDLYQHLDAIVSRSGPSSRRPAANDTPSTPRVAIADSKQLYRPGGDLRGLESGLKFALTACDRPARCWLELIRQVCPDLPDTLAELPWHAGFNPPLPIHSQSVADDTCCRHWVEHCGAQGVRLVDCRARLVFPREFNQGVERYASKGTLLSHHTLDLVAEVVRPLDDEPIRIVCDKHGGRNHYGALLQACFPGRLVRVGVEGREVSHYDVGTPTRPIKISFRVGGESFLPSALASMLAKYLRELSMLAFNQFWQHELPGLRPTAGYPQDAARFRREIAERQRQLGIPDELIWRCR